MSGLARITATAACATLLSACGAPQDIHTDLRRSLAEARAVRTCPNGAVVGRDHQGALVFIRQGPATFSSSGIAAGYLAPGMTPDQFCGNQSPGRAQP